MPAHSKEADELRHPRARELAAAYQKRAVDRDGFVTPDRGRAFVLAVTAGSFGRAVRFLDSLFVRLEAEGCEILLTEKGHQSYGGRGRGVMVARGESIPFLLREDRTRRPHVLTPEERIQKRQGYYFLIPRWDFTPTGTLRLAFDPPLLQGVRKTWSDARGKTIETKLDAIVENVRDLADATRSARLKWEEAVLRREREADAIAAEEEKALEEKRLLAALVSEARAWADAQVVRSYVSALRRDTRAASRPAGLARWLAWAEKAADSFDPTNSRICGEWDAESE